MNITFQSAISRVCQVTEEFKKAMDVPDKVAKVALSTINLLKEMGFFVLTFAKTSTTLVGVVMMDDALNPFSTGVNILNGDTKVRTINLMAVQVLNAVKAAKYFELIHDFKWLPDAVSAIPFAAVINPLVISLSLLGVRDNLKRPAQIDAVVKKATLKIAHWKLNPNGIDHSTVCHKIAKWENKQANSPIEKRKALNAIIADILKVITASLALLPLAGIVLPTLFIATVGFVGTCALGYRTGYNVWASSQLRDVKPVPIPA